MAMQFDPLTDTAEGDCIPGCIRVDSDRYPHATLFRVPLYSSTLRRCGVPDVYELWQLVEEVVNGSRVDCEFERTNGNIKQDLSHGTQTV